MTGTVLARSRVPTLSPRLGQCGPWEPGRLTLPPANTASLCLGLFQVWSLSPGLPGQPEPGLRPGPDLPQPSPQPLPRPRALPL